MTFTSIIFIAVISVMIAIYTASGTQFNNQPNTGITTSLTNANIQQGTQQAQTTLYVTQATTTEVFTSYYTITDVNNIPNLNFVDGCVYGPYYQGQVCPYTVTTTNTQDTTGTVSSTNNICTSSNYIGDVYCSLVNTNNALVTWSCNNVANIPAIGSILTEFSACNPKLPTSQLNNYVVNGAQQLVGSQVGASFQNVSNNSILGLLSNPLNEALLVVGVFLSLGILAGLFGAGILARAMALVGLSLAFVTYIEGELSVFQGMPDYLWWMVNGIFTIILAIIIYEGFSESGGLG